MISLSDTASRQSGAHDRRLLCIPERTDAETDRGGWSAGADIQPAPHERLVFVGQRSLGKFGGEGLLSSAVWYGTRPQPGIAEISCERMLWMKRISNGNQSHAKRKHI